MSAQLDLLTAGAVPADWQLRNEAACTGQACGARLTCGRVRRLRDDVVQVVVARHDPRRPWQAPVPVERCRHYEETP